ncbi:MAG TPA: PhoPQ-activated pathogenicity-related family protein [Verrucomicrobiae bacterium]|nr:PhoPQ-activated pathogenicity-related family protein [Verrucomicrobiae bacterium]
MAALFQFIPFGGKVRAARQSLLILALMAGLGSPVFGGDTISQGYIHARPAADRTALDAYVAAPDTNYNYHLVRSFTGKDYTSFLLEMTSQAWLTTNEVDRPLWKHWLLLTRPNEVSSSRSLLYISGGANDGKEPKGPDQSMAQIAVATKTVITELRMVPNQPLVFAGETGGKSEDAIIAYTWDKFLRTGDAKWPARLPMTKAAVRAMDTVTDFCSGPDCGNLKVSEFIVAGGSKRGWTTWTTAAVDNRVIAIIPIVIDLLNIEPSMLHHYAAYGFWAPSIGDYTALRIMDWTGTPQYRALMRIEEPYQYRSRLTMPKFLICATGDQFFLPDSSQFYFDDLAGVKYLRYVPNADHSLKGSDARESLLACYNAVVREQPLPRLTWKIEPDGSIRAHTPDKPVAVKLWQATNPEARDFRIETFGPKWESTPLTEQSAGEYVASVAPPAKGWTAFFIEFNFPSSCQVPFKFTTPVRVVPDTLPYKFVSAGPPK